MMDETTQSLKDELAQAQADLEENATLAEINQTLVDMLDWMKSRKAEVQPAPVVKVEVSPTPVTIQNTVTVQRGGMKHSFAYDAQDRLISGTSIPIQTKAQT